MTDSMDADNTPSSAGTSGDGGGSRQEAAADNAAVSHPPAVISFDDWDREEGAKEAEAKAAAAEDGSGDAEEAPPPPEEEAAATPTPEDEPGGSAAGDGGDDALSVPDEPLHPRVIKRFAEAYSAELLVASPCAALRFLAWPSNPKATPAQLVFTSAEEVQAEKDAQLAHPFHSVLLLGPEINK